MRPNGHHLHEHVFFFLKLPFQVCACVCVYMCGVGNQEQTLHAKSGGRGGRAGHSSEMTSHHSHTPAQECWENRRGGWDAGWEVGGGRWGFGRMTEQRGERETSDEERVSLR